MQNVNKLNWSGYNYLLRIYREADLSQEKTRVLGSLQSCHDPEIILEILNFLLSSEVRSQDVVHRFGVGIEGRDWQWLKENWDQIVSLWCWIFYYSFITVVVSQFCSYEKAAEVAEFFASRMKSCIARTLKQSIEGVHINAKWVQRIQNEKNLADAVTELSYRKSSYGFIVWPGNHLIIVLLLRFL